jgi:hypothetical protein
MLSSYLGAVWNLSSGKRKDFGFGIVSYCWFGGVWMFWISWRVDGQVSLGYCCQYPVTRRAMIGVSGFLIPLSDCFWTLS